MARPSVLVLGTLLGACAADGDRVSLTRSDAVRIAHLAAAELDPSGFAALREAFVARNPGYDIEHAAALPKQGTRSHRTRIVFIQSGRGDVMVDDGRQAPDLRASPVGVGDVVVLRPGELLIAPPGIGAVTFTAPDKAWPPVEVPTFIRPDWDPRITDTPGGCATETGAYRRILLTWLGKNGPYLWDVLNAHRVRITDSFTHYHPRDGGFDEFYLVQGVQPGARILTSERLDRVLDPETVTRDEARGLLVSRELRAGDLVYLPRGVVHRGLGGVLAQVITIPGFVPGAEIGVDAQILRINERLGLRGDASLPAHHPATTSPAAPVQPAAPGPPAASRPGS